MVLCMIVASIAIMPVQAQDDTAISAKIAGPSVVNIGDVTQYTITISGGPAQATNGTYSYTVTMSGYASTNATLTPNTGSSATGVFNFNLTTPKVTGGLTLKLSAASKNQTGTVTTYNNLTTFSVNVVNPVTFSVTIKNTGNMTVTNIPVYFYVDPTNNPNPIYITNVTINALSSKTVTYNWTHTTLGAGSHELKVQIDTNKTFVLFDVGGTVMTTTFYYNQSGYGTTNALLYVALIVLVFVVILVYRRPMPRKKK